MTGYTRFRFSRTFKHKIAMKVSVVLVCPAGRMRIEIDWFYQIATRHDRSREQNQCDCSYRPVSHKSVNLKRGCTVVAPGHTASEICVVGVTRNTRLQIIHCFNGVPSTITRSPRPAWSVCMRHDQIFRMTVRTELNIEMAALARRFERLCIERVCKLPIKRMRESIQVFTIMTILTEVLLMAGLTGKIAIDRIRIEPGQISVGLPEIDSMTRRRQLVVLDMAGLAGGRYRAVFVTAHACKHGRKNKRFDRIV